MCCRRTSWWLVLVLALAAVGGGGARSQTPPSRAVTALPEAQAKKIIGGRSQAALRALHAGQLSRFARYVDPVKGVRFSPSSVPGAGERVLSRAQVRALGRDAKAYTWGSVGDPPRPVRMTWKSYVHNYVFFSVNPSPTEEIVHTATPGVDTQGSAMSFYPADAIFVLYYGAGTSPEQGHDQYDVYFVWQKRGAVWYLTGIVHSHEDNSLLWRE